MLGSWSLYRATDEWHKIQNLPSFLAIFWATLAQTTLLWTSAFAALEVIACTLCLVPSAAGEVDTPIHPPFIAHSLADCLPLAAVPGTAAASSFLRFWRNHGRHSDDPRSNAPRDSQLAAMDGGAVFVRLSPYPDLFTGPGSAGPIGYT